MSCEAGIARFRWVPFWDTGKCWWVTGWWVPRKDGRWGSVKGHVNLGSARAR